MVQVTRRMLARLALAAAAAQAAKPQVPQPDAGAALDAARAQLRGYFQQLSAAPLPADTEPAFRFKV